MRYPAQFILVAAANPCPCGYFGTQIKPCHCLPGEIERYRKRVSGPILDRIDLHVTVQAVNPAELVGLPTGDPSSIIRQKVQAARNRQLKRFSTTQLVCNADMGTREVKKFSPLKTEVENKLLQLTNYYHLSARTHFKCIKVARTITDLAGDDDISVSHLVNAVQFRT